MLYVKPFNVGELLRLLVYACYLSGGLYGIATLDQTGVVFGVASALLAVFGVSAAFACAFQVRVLESASLCIIAGAELTRLISHYMVTDAVHQLHASLLTEILLLIVVAASRIEGELSDG